MRIKLRLRDELPESHPVRSRFLLIEALTATGTITNERQLPRSRVDHPPH